jgi:hypothetical protein
MVLGLALYPSAAFAQPGHGAEADQFFRQGVADMKADNCPEAIPKFLNSQQLDPSAGTLVNLATCYARLGRSASAYRSFRQAQDLAEREQSAELAERAARGLARLAPTLTKLVIVPPRDAVGLSLKLNGEPIAASDTALIPLDPGENTFEASMPGRDSWRHRLLATDRSATIVVEIPELVAVRVEPANWRPAAVIVGGVGVASIVAGSILALNAKATSNQASENCGEGTCNEQGTRALQDGLSKAMGATYLFALGGALSAGGVALWVLSPAQRAQRFAIEPWAPVQGSGWGLSLRGSL